MGFFDFFNKRTIAKPASASVISSDELKDQLFDCIYMNKLVEFEHLCHEHEADILRFFPEWKRPPEEMQTDKEAIRKYSYCLMIIASNFQKQHNNGELMTMLTGIDDSEQSRVWQEQLGKSRTLMQQQLNFDEAIPILENCLDISENVSGAVIDKFLPLTLGFLGECYFHKNQPARAAEYVERALQLTTMQGDYDASFAYRSNLFEICRYMGDSEKAARYAQEIADKAYDRGDLVAASNWRHNARSVAAGEPPYRIVVRIGEELFEMNEIPKIQEERVEFIFTRNRMELVLCTQKCSEASQAAGAGEFDKALKILEEAVSFDPYSPHPLFLSGQIKLAGKQYAEAVADLEKVEKLCPGFESSRCFLWLARLLEKNAVQHDACMVIFEASNDATALEDRLKMCRELLAKYPKYGEVFWRTGKMLVESEKNDEALTVFKQGLAVAADPDLRSRLLRDIAVLTTDEEEKVKYLKDTVAVQDGNALAQAMAAYMLRQREPE
jgi:tetratricopeptide (TPR) repeat protein